MSRTTDRPVLVSLAEVARIAGVGRAAVSNWRRRYEDFPGPLGGTDSSPQFGLSEVEAWLRTRGKLDEENTALDRLWPHFESLGERDAMGVAIAEVGTEAMGGRRDVAPAARTDLSEAQSHAVSKAMRVAGREGTAETFTFLLNRWLGAHVRQITSTPEPLAHVMAELADLSRGTPVGGVRRAHTVLDPACGVGGLLEAARKRGAAGTVRLLGQDSDPVTAQLAACRLALSQAPKGGGRKAPPAVDIRATDTLRADVYGPGVADVVLCSPPTNERDWGHAELAADPRWAHGHPPRTESELAWVQHASAALKPGGVAVLLLPPGVASRKAGRRIRTGLLRAGVLRTVVALPPGAAPPHGVALHLWVLRAPRAGERPESSDVLFVDTTAVGATPEQTAPNWPAIAESVRDAVLRHSEDGDGELPQGAKSVPVVDLLDEHTDLTPAHHVPAASALRGAHLRRSWSRFATLLDDLQELTADLSELPDATAADRKSGETTGTTTVGELLAAGALTMRGGRRPAGARIREGTPPPGELPFLTVADVQRDGTASSWLPAVEATTETSGDVVMTAPGDLVVTASARAFDAWIDERAPTVLGSQLYALTVDPAALDPWFLAGHLRLPGNARRAGTHASTSSRIDVRRLRVPLLPLAEQRRLGEGFRRLARFEGTLREAGRLGEDLVQATSAGFSGGEPAG